MSPSTCLLEAGGPLPHASGRGVFEDPHRPSRGEHLNGLPTPSRGETHQTRSPRPRRAEPSGERPSWQPWERELPAPPRQGSQQQEEPGEPMRTSWGGGSSGLCLQEDQHGAGWSQHGKGAWGGEGSKRGRKSSWGLAGAPGVPRAGGWGGRTRGAVLRAGAALEGNAIASPAGFRPLHGPRAGDAPGRCLLQGPHALGSTSTVHPCTPGEAKAAPHKAQLLPAELAETSLSSPQSGWDRAGGTR